MQLVGVLFNPRFLLIMLVLVAAWFGLQALHGLAAEMPGINGISDGSQVDHAYKVHGAEGDQADNCFHQHGLGDRIYKAYDQANKRMTFHFICQDDMGSFFDYITDDKGGKLTSFQPGETGKLDEIIKWIFRKPQARLIPVKALPEELITTFAKMGIPNLP